MILAWNQEGSYTQKAEELIYFTLRIHTTRGAKN